MKIPKRFQLLGHTITVRMVSAQDWDAFSDQYEGMAEAVGFWCPAENLILIKRQKRSLAVHTLIHEITHAVLHYMSHPLNKDERFVDSFAGLLAQALETAE